MSSELELWQFIETRLQRGERVMLLVVGESTGSSPGRRGYKMAVSADGDLIGSIGGGVMEVALVERAREDLAAAAIDDGPIRSRIVEQVHRRDSPNSSGMICSGTQTVIFRCLGVRDLEAAQRVIRSIVEKTGDYIHISADEFGVLPTEGGTQNDRYSFERHVGSDFVYSERLGTTNELLIIGGGHCSLALSELMSRMDFRITIFDDRPDLNTIEKNRFADEIRLIESYEQIGELVASGSNVFIVVMTLGYVSDGVVIRHLIDKEFKYFGVLGSKAKMATMLKELVAEGYPKDRLDRLHTPIGLPINSRTPEEIAVSIAAEIIGVKNA